MNPIYVKDRAGFKFIATTQMVRRIESGELALCDPPTAQELEATRRAQRTRHEATAQMLATVPKNIPVRADAPPAGTLDAIAQSIAAYEAAGKGAAAIQTDAEAAAELAEIRAKTAALEAAVAAGQVTLVDPSTVLPGTLTGQGLPASAALQGFTALAPADQALAVGPAPQAALAPVPQVSLAPADVPPAPGETAGNFQTAFQPAHPQMNVWGGLSQG